ncbi:MAG TPA: uroporphyrinogen-III decarboxylase-like protein, partial [Phycisphaerae bacterium]|nr:uroporphyrinogen-III decarboxylase-like protein [Phycisphaerae bacterium]
ELMGYETLCYALFEQRDLVSAISKRLEEISVAALVRILEFDRVEMILAQDDMGFRTGTLISPDDLREFLLPIHKSMARVARGADRLYLFHCCGKIDAIMEYAIEDVGIDAKHSFEDTIESIIDAKALYGERIALLGGIDVNFLCTSSEQEVRKRVLNTLEQCIPGGGYCLGTGNSVANYIPVDNYLAMLDEGRRFVP